MPHAIRRTILTVLLLGISGALCWYGVSVNRLTVRDFVFVKNHFQVLQPFTDAWLLWGNLAYYDELDPRRAAADYRQAIVRQPTAIGAWLNLAKAELAAGREDEARRILQTLSPLITHVSTWKWQELLLARDLQDEERFAAAFNFILARLPLRVSEASFLAKGFWGDSSAVLPHLAPGSREAFLIELMKAKESGPAFALWKTMQAADPPPGKGLQLRFCQFLLNNDRVGYAKEVWAAWRSDGKETVYDGGFEMEPTNKGFGWYLTRNPDALVERSSEAPVEGRYSLHLRFLGLKNVNFWQVYQIIPVEGGRVYRLSFARKGQGLSTDQGVLLYVSGYQCEGLGVRSNPVLGTTSWTKEELEVHVPEGCEAIQLNVTRGESLMFDSKISGDYWLDSVELTEQHAP